MARQLEEIFNECIERLRQGDSVENCLMNYPEVAADLEILLRTALNVNWRGSMVQPRPEFKAYARAQLFNVQYAMSQERQPAARKPSLFSLRHAWVPALAMVVLLLFSSVGTAAAAANAMPDEPLYPVKLATEQVRMSFAFSDEVRADINVKLAETRSQEIATMATQGKTEQVIVATDRLAQHIEAADQAIRKVEEMKERQAPPPPPTPTITAPTPAPSTSPAPVPAQPPTTAPTTPTPPPPPDKPKDATGQAGVQQAPPQERTKVKAVAAEKLRQELRATISRNLTVLENARDKAPEREKPALQKAIDLAKTRQLQLQQPPGTGTPIKPGTKPPTTGPGQAPPNPQNVPGSTGTKGSEEPTQRPGSQGSGGTTPVTPSPATPVVPKGTSSTGNGTGDADKPSTSTTLPAPSTDSPSTTIK